MKTASAATLAILATGQYIKLEFYEFTLADGTTVLRYTNADVPVKVGANTYQTGLTILRSASKQKMGLGVQQLELEIWPQGDNPAGSITIGGYPFLRAVNLGLFDGARLLFSKGFFNPPVYGSVDTTPGIVAWNQGKVSNAVASRSRARISIGDDTQQLNVMMPRNVLQTGCVHSLYDAGCTLVKGAGGTSTIGAVTGSPGVLQFNSNVGTSTDGFYDLGTILWLTGALAGISRTVRAYLYSSGAQFTLFNPLPAIPAVGDTFRCYAGCDKTQATCSSKFSNLAHFRGYPYVPVPETLYDGGTPNAPAPALGGQGGGGAGSAFTGIVDEGSYAP